MKKTLNIKQFISYCVALGLLLGNAAPVFAQDTPITKEIKSSGKTIQGQVEYNQLDSDMFTGQIESVEKGSKLIMTVSSVMHDGYHIKGDEFFAEVTDEFSTQSGTVLPAGTVAHGIVTEMKDKKRMGRDAYISLKFDYLITPDNRKIPIEASMTTKRSAAGSAAKIVLEDTAYTMAGGIIGGILAFKVLGLGATVASNGYTVAGGAGLGAAVGLTASLFRKGHDVLIQPGDEIRVTVDENVSLPVISEKALRDQDLILEGLDVKILGYSVEKDPFGELNTINLILDIKNQTDKSFSTFDMALVSDYNTVYYASPFGDTSMWFQKITPNSITRGSLSFSVDNPKKRHWLVFYDSRTRKPVAKFSLKNAEREIKKRTAKK